MSPNDLPIELLLQILQEYSHDPNSLKTFSLISPPFLAACRRLLFQRLCIDRLNPVFDDKCTSWAGLLERSPDIACHFRVLELGPPIFRIDRLRDPEAYSSHWNTITNRQTPSIHDTRIQFIMEQSVNVHTLTLRFEFQAWKYLSPSFQHAVTSIALRDNMVSLHLEDAVDFPLETLTRSICLRHLTLVSLHQYSTPDPDTCFEKHVSDRKGSLETLTLFSSDQCVDHLTRILGDSRSSLRLERLVRLSINATGLDGRLALQRIPPLARQIIILELRVSQSNTPFELCKLDDFPALRVLLLSATYHRALLKGIASLISKSRTPSQLERLQILFRHDIPDQLEKSSPGLVSMFTSKDWQILERKLLTEGKFCALDKLTLIFRPKDVQTFMNDQLKLTLQIHLMKIAPRLCASTNPTIEVWDDRFEGYTQLK